jgi:hypothetical protein
MRVVTAFAIVALATMTDGRAQSKFTDAQMIWPKNSRFQCVGTLKIDADESAQEKEVLYQLDPVEGMLAWCDAYLAGERATKVLKTCKVGSNCEIKGEISGHGIFAWRRIDSVRKK